MQHKGREKALLWETTQSTAHGQHLEAWTGFYGISRCVVEEVAFTHLRYHSLINKSQ